MDDRYAEIIKGLTNDKTRNNTISNYTNYRNTLLSHKDIWMKLHEIELHVGDRVWSMAHGWGIVEEDASYPEIFFVRYIKSKSLILLADTSLLFWNEFKIPKEAFIKPLAVDTKVIVWANNCNSHKQHFKEFSKNGKIVCFSYGKTSFTAHDNDWTRWDNWELYEEKGKK